MFKGILLDFDNTLYGYESVHISALLQVYVYVSKTYSVEYNLVTASYERARKEIHMELSGTAASHNRLLYFQRMLEILKLNAPAYALDVYERYWSLYLDFMEISYEVFDFLDSVRDRFRICLVTDLTAEIQYRKMNKAGLTKYIDYIVTSEEAGVEKPHPYIFHLALRKLGMTAQEVCMIGDSYERDIVGALNMDIQPFWLFKRPPEGTPQRVVVFESFDELEVSKYFAR
ncbi:MAG: HAD family hydrolase [Nitrospirae bacterium YQR-1]